MRSFFTVSLLVVFVLVRPNHSFVVPIAGGWSTRTATAATTLWSKDVDSIARELEEMDGTKKKSKHSHKVRSSGDHTVEGFDKYHESLVHKLRRELYEKDKQMHILLNELENSLLTSTTAFELAELSENSYRKEHQLYQEEHESVRRLLWQAMKLVGRRIKNGFLWVVRFGRVPKKEQSNRKQ
ncbi:hypothetical protein IV203_033366 [Nitzschia inconspicua]|uniref:Uncharacterized protein n=1 Tax=Nitzschia inconspicua TaxID=303405 RepID=A0A9K3PFZ6_9STRA|nr:hypothetical protein IV203_033366 [Nitzschia inconspicua]